MLKKKLLSKIIFFIFSINIHAQSYTISQMKEAIASNNSDLQKLHQEYSRSLLDVKDAKAGLGPSIDLLVTGTYMTNPPVDAIYVNVDEIINSINWPSGYKPSSGGQHIKLYDGMENTMYNFQLSVTQPVFTWGKLTNAVKLYEQIADIKQLQILSRQQILETELQTRTTSLFYLERIKQILLEEQQYIEKLITYSEDAEKSGMLLHEDVVDAKIQAKEVQIALQDLNEQIKTQLLELEKLTGLKINSADEIENLFDEQIIKEILSCNREEVEQKALSQNSLSLRMLYMLKEVNVLSEKIAKEYVNWKPDIALQITASYGGSRFPLAEPSWLLKDDYSANLTLAVKTTIWDGGKKLNDIARKNSDVKTAELNIEDSTEAIRKTLISNWNTADVCLMKIDYQVLKIEAAETKIQQKEKIFQSGYGSEADVLKEKIDRCNQMIEKEKQSLSLAAACFTIKYLCE